MPVKRTTPPKQSVFATDPATGKPFISVDHADRIICKNISLKHRSMLEKFEMDDLKQDCFARLVLCEYCPTKSSPTTYIINLSDQVIWNRWRYSNSFGRNLAVPEFSVMGDDAEFVSIVSTLTDNVTPEDIALADEFVRTWSNEQALLPEYRRVRVPKFDLDGTALSLKPRKMAKG